MAGWVSSGRWGVEARVDVMVGRYGGQVAGGR